MLLSWSTAVGKKNSYDKIMKLAIVHEVLTEFGGAERTLEAIHAIWPEAPVYTLMYTPETLKRNVDGWDIRPSPLQRNLFKHQWRLLRPEMPTAIESFDLAEYDVVLSSSSAFAHGVLTRPETLHLCYYHAPMRFAWDYKDQYLVEHNATTGPKSWLLRRIIHKLRSWDQLASTRPDIAIANSVVTAARLKKYYRRNKATIIHPPVEIDRFKLAEKAGEHYLVISRLSPYKQVEMAVAACTQMKRKLVVIGEGADRVRLERLAGPSVQFVGKLPDAAVADYLSRAKAVIFPTADDFGIVPVEAMAAGRPVIAYGQGGALETVVSGKTGVFFAEQTVDSLAAAIKQFEDTSVTFKPAAIRQHAEQWGTAVFQTKLKQFVETEYAKRQN